MININDLIAQGLKCSNCKHLIEVPCSTIVDGYYPECELTDNKVDMDEFFCAWFEAKDSK